MPIYAYQCETCNLKFERVVSLKDYDQPQRCECGGPSKKLVTPVNFVLKGDGWPGKNFRIKNQMARKNAGLDRRMNEMKKDQPLVTLAPNVDGEQVSSWTEAKKLAASKGKNTATYDKHIAKEKAG